MQKLLLVNPPSKYKVIRDYYCGHFVKGDYFWAPIDLVMLSRLDDYDIKVIDFMVEKNLNEKVSEAKNFKPNIIIGLVWDKILEDDINFLKKLKEETAAEKLFFIGDVTKFNSPKLIEYGIKDYALKSFYHLEDSGLGRFSLPKHYLFNLRKYGMPYSLRKKVATVLTAYACPFKCKFCNSGSYPYEERPLEEIIEELKQIKNLGVEEIYFRDFTFTANEKRVQELYKLMNDNNLNFDWSCDGRVNVSYETLKIMKNAGCYLVFFGVESINKKTLEAMNKGITPEMILRAFSDCRKLGIKILASFIIGLPGEGEIEINNTLEFAKKYCDYVSFNTFESRLGASLQIEKGSVELTKKIEKSFYFRPSYLVKQLFSVRTKTQFRNFIRNGLSILRK
jgi:hypothetical protein